MNKEEVKESLIKYLNKKGIEIQHDEDNLIWKCESNGYIYNVSIYINSKSSNDLSGFIIRYYTNQFHLKRKKTSVAVGFGLKVYKNLIFIKEKLDKISYDLKNENNRIKKYCLELENYYKRKHNRVTISTNENFDKTISIYVNCYDNVKTFYYHIIFDNNRYYLYNKITNCEIEIPI